MNSAGEETRKAILKTLLAMPSANLATITAGSGKSRTAVVYQLQHMLESGFIREDTCACCGAAIRVVVQAWPT